MVRKTPHSYSPLKKKHSYNWWTSSEMRICSPELHLMARTQVPSAKESLGFLGLRLAVLRCWPSGTDPLRNQWNNGRMLMVGENHILHPAKNLVNSCLIPFMSLGNVIWQYMSQMRQISVSSLLDALKCSTCFFCWIAMSTLDGWVTKMLAILDWPFVKSHDRRKMLDHRETV